MNSACKEICEFVCDACEDDIENAPCNQGMDDYEDIDSESEDLLDDDPLYDENENDIEGDVFDEDDEDTE